MWPYILSLFLSVAYADLSDQLKSTQDGMACSEQIRKICGNGKPVSCMTAPETLKQLPENCKEHAKCEDELFSHCMPGIKSGKDFKTPSNKDFQDCFKFKKNLFSPNCYKKYVPSDDILEIMGDADACEADEKNLCPEEYKNKLSPQIEESRKLDFCIKKKQSQLSETCKQAKERMNKKFGRKKL